MTNVISVISALGSVLVGCITGALMYYYQLPLNEGLIIGACLVFTNLLGYAEGYMTGGVK